MDNITAAESYSLDMKLAEFFFACNIPFATCESQYFKNFVKALRPIYNPPNRKRLATTLVDNVHEKIEQRNSEAMTRMNKQATLLIDGWQNSSSNRHNVVTMLATAEDEKFFLESYDFSSERETGLNLFKAVENSVSLAKERYGIDVYAVASDNAANMVYMGNTAAFSSMFVFFTLRFKIVMVRDTFGYLILFFSWIAILDL